MKESLLTVPTEDYLTILSMAVDYQLQDEVMWGYIQAKGIDCLETLSELDLIKVALVFMKKGFYEEEFHEYFLDHLSSMFTVSMPSH